MRLHEGEISFKGGQGRVKDHAQTPLDALDHALDSRSAEKNALLWGLFGAQNLLDVPCPMTRYECC